MVTYSGPDLSAAIMLKLKDSTYLSSTFVGDRIFVQWPKGVTVPQVAAPNSGKFQNCILVETGRGGAGEIGSGLQQERVDIKCYGADRKTSYDLWRAVDYYLLPKDERTKTSFTKAYCRVNVVQREAGPLRLIDNDLKGWPYCVASYIFTFSGMPTNA